MDLFMTVLYNRTALMEYTVNIIDNGFTDFFANVKPETKSVTVTSRRDELLLTASYTDVFVGKDVPLETRTCDCPRDYDSGNSLLIHLRDQKYILVSLGIRYFETTEPITEFIAPMGNSGMVSAYMISDNFVYCFYWGSFYFEKTEDSVKPNFHVQDHNLAPALTLSGLENLVPPCCEYKRVLGTVEHSSGLFTVTITK